MKKTFKKISLYTVLLFAISFNTAFAEVIKSIEVKGNYRISETAVKAGISYREGDDITPNDYSEIIKELYNTGSFSNVNVNFTDGKLVISVQENAVYNNFKFEGNKIAKTEDLLKVVGVKIRSIYSKRSEKLALNNVRQYYKSRGYYSVKIKLKKENKSNNRVDLVFQIEEGEVATIKNINFIGNEAYSDSQLRDVILSKEDAWWRFLSDDDIYDKGRVNVDKSLLFNFYQNRGYADVRIKSVDAELSKDKKDFFLTYKINEGKRYKLGKVSIKNWKSGIDKERINSLLVDGDKAGYISSRSIAGIIDNINDELSAQGISFVELKPNLKKYQKNGKNYIDVEIEMTKSRRIFIEKIVVRGNTRTLDRVIRKELKIVEGDPFNSSLMRSSENNIRRLGYFSDVRISFAEGSSPNKAIVYIDVKEQSTGSAGFGLGYSTTDGIVVKLSLSEKNFLGRGQALSTSLTKTGNDLGGSVSFTEPYFMGRDLSATGTVSRRHIDRMKRHSYKAKENVLGVSFAYDLNEKWSQSFGYKYRDYNLYELGSNASLSIKDEKGRSRGHTIFTRLGYEDLDDFMNPTEGFKTNATVYLKSLNTKYKHTYIDVRGSYYYPVTEKSVLTLSGTGTQISGYENLRFIDRLYLNSDYIIGFDKVGPMDKKSTDLLGGTKRITASAELDFPIGLPASMGIKGSVFYNAAMLRGTPKHSKLTVVGESPVRQTIGTSIKWASPIGPMRFSFSKTLKKADTDQNRGFQFIVGFGI